ncbi:MAG: AAA domain-containing protein, partial [Lachnospiraceae bacterium]
VPAVQSFRRRVHEQRIDRFVKTDEKQYALSQKRIRDRIISTYPRTNQMAKAGSELGILRHEMEKKRRIMPLRKLFQSIPNLLLTLKPCLMMSPLSVAYFLEAGSYQFDMVIFDEASQIFPQDAIGAIFRAKQVVIAGDTKQLPPTSFFASSTGNGDDVFDDEDSYDDEVYYSILEETANILPNRTLLWHYRSKHEHLIAFSNQEIYKGELVTFPSSNESERDTGVEFVYVEDGYYEGGGKNCNVLEARRIVQLIKEHIDRHPTRSLGVIAFSEKQQNAIALEVQRFREKNSEYEEFFAEGKEDEFFIKNLENVQGDERDTIIFSVGYAKTKEQKANNKPMAMRFGPLGVQGGERRLNVAITRAKTNVKLVSSILPSDIDLNRTESDGVRMLRSYIEFAMNGDATIAAARANAKPDDFVDAVAKFLTEHGYKVSQYVGCSGYKIDIAVEHPSEIIHQFAAGIECDGYSYASSRTARDRDRLRGSVLKNMGWNMYRVWSAEWYKNPEVEGEKLLAFIKSAIDECDKKVKAIEEEKRKAEEALRKAEEAKRKEQERIKAEQEAAERKRLEEAAQREAEAKAAKEAKRREAAQRQAAQEEARREAARKQWEEERRRKEAEQKAKTPKVDISWVKKDALAKHKSFGIGSVKKIEDGYINIAFPAGEKRFAIPSAFETGFLTKPAPGENTSSSANTPKQPTRTGSKSPAELIRELAAKGFTCIDNRSTSGIVWVLYSSEKKTSFETIVAGYNVQYKLEKRGAMATKNAPAWRIMFN